jgi:hypothetical protein
MLIVSFVTLASVNVPSVKIKLMEITISSFGLIYTFFLHLLSNIIASWNDFLRDNYLIKIDPLYQEIRKARRIPFRNLQSHWIPATLGLTWAALLLIVIL